MTGDVPRPTGANPRALWLVKWGGGLITDKDRREGLLPEVLDRLAAELASGSEGCPARIVLGHGSGSFGHWAAHSGTPADDDGCYQPATAAEVAQAAGRLHRKVVGALLDAGARPFSWPPSACLTTDRNTDEGALSTFRAALAGGFLPVTLGDVVLDSAGKARIWSTERVFEELVGGLERLGMSVERILWLGNTDGILDGDGRRIDRVEVGDDRRVLAATVGSRGVDVTGGMRLRYQTCRRLAERGVESWILDGREQGVLDQALRSVRTRGTLIEAEPAAQ